MMWYWRILLVVTGLSAVDIHRPAPLLYTEPRENPTTISFSNGIRFDTRLGEPILDHPLTKSFEVPVDLSLIDEIARIPEALWLQLWTPVALDNKRTWKITIHGADIAYGPQPFVFTITSNIQPAVGITEGNLGHPPFAFHLNNSITKGNLTIDCRRARIG